MRTPDADVLIIGAGVTGLWARFTLAASGYRVLTLERSAMGDGQTAASQGILHRGLKYAMSAGARRATDELQRAQGAWGSALAGEQGPDLRLPDLRAVRVLARTTHLWTSPGMGARLAGEAASRLMLADVRRLEPGERPGVFAAAPDGVRVWAVEEPVVDPSSLLAELARAGDGAGAGPVLLAPGVRLHAREPAVRAEWGGGTVDAGVVLLCAGEGNDELLRRAGLDDGSAMQRRPLHMVVAHGAPAPVFGHCLAMSDKPRLTVTSDSTGAAWYLGGGLAEEGVERGEPEQIDAARRELRECLGWVDASRLALRTLRIDRAEGRTPEGKRPDTPVLRAFGPGGRVLAVWPTKLALAPIAAASALAHGRDRLGPGRREPLGECPGERAPVAGPPWLAGRHTGFTP